MKDLKEKIEYIYKEQKEISLLQGINGLVGFDAMTYMPVNGTNARAEHSALLEELIHKKLTNPILLETLNNLLKEDLAEKDKIVVKKFHKHIEKKNKVPSDFVAKMSSVVSLSGQAWQEAKQENKLGKFLPHLEKIVDLKREEARILNPDISAYDVLLDDFEEGMTCEKLDKMFEPLKKNLTNFISQIKETDAFKKQETFNPKVEESVSKEIVKDILDKMQIKKESVHIGVSAHPITFMIAPGDIRLNTRYINFTDAFYTSIHEAGHALYDLNMPEEYQYTFGYYAPSLGMHESQSKFWENMVTKSYSFWEGYTPIANKFLGLDLSPRDYYKSTNQVIPGQVRLDADELTYIFHIIIRYEIGKALVNKDIEVKDIKEVWNEKMKTYIGVEPESDSKGVLQDMHWASGYIGYFPTYVIGDIYSKQLFHKMQADVPEINDKIKELDFIPVIDWLRKNVHQYGGTMLAEEIIQKACGKVLDVELYIKYFEDKYKDIYGM